MKRLLILAALLTANLSWATRNKVDPTTCGSSLNNLEPIEYTVKATDAHSIGMYSGPTAGGTYQLSLSYSESPRELNISSSEASIELNHTFRLDQMNMKDPVGNQVDCLEKVSIFKTNACISEISTADQEIQFVMDQKKSGVELNALECAAAILKDFKKKVAATKKKAKKKPIPDIAISGRPASSVQTNTGNSTENSAEIQSPIILGK